MCRPKHVEQLRNIGILSFTTRLHLVGSFYEIYITMHGSINIKFVGPVFRNVELSVPEQNRPVEKNSVCFGDVSHLLHKAEARLRQPHIPLNKSTRLTWS